MRFLQRFAQLSLLLCCGACAVFAPGERFGATPAGFEQLPGWTEDNHAAALAAFRATCPQLVKQTPSASNGSGLLISQPLWQSLCSDAYRVSPGQARGFFERRFTPFRVTANGNEQGLFTGYYEPVLYASTHKTGDYRYPIYAAPPELKTHKPYFTRADIDNGAIAGRHLEIAWADDPVMLFFMQIQGSGRLRLPGGKQLLLGYADKNGQPYISLGKVMGDEGLMPKDQINFFTLREWLYKHPDKAFALMQRNPAYVFFRKLDTSGPVGAAGSVLVPRRSLAVDNSFIPYGLPLFLDAELPARNGGTTPFRRIMIAQDTGIAIKGPVRGDIFFGGGSEAEYYAGSMHGRGNYTLLVPKEIEYQLR